MREDKLLVQDILDAIAEVTSTLPTTQAEFDANKLVKSHVLRNIQIIGEASWRMSSPLKTQFPQVPWSRIAGMRHILVHDYFQVDWNLVYETARDHVPLLKPQIDSILASLP